MVRSFRLSLGLVFLALSSMFAYAAPPLHDPGVDVIAFDASAPAYEAINFEPVIFAKVHEPAVRGPAFSTSGRTHSLLTSATAGLAPCPERTHYRAFAVPWRA